MRLVSAALTTLLAAASVATTVSVSQAQTCQELWVERNQ
jgi:hypothetical protein